MTTGGDPDELEHLAAAGRGQTFSLDRTWRWLARVASWHRASTPASRVDAVGAAARLARWTSAIVDLDRWTADVAAALRAADAASFDAALLALGPRHPVTALAVGAAQPPTRDDLAHMTDDDLAAIVGVPGLPGPWRDAVHRERLRRWVRGLDGRIATVPPDGVGAGALDRVAAWVDRTLVDRLSVVTDLHVTRQETIDRLRAEATGARRLLSHPDLTVWSFDLDAGRPTVRVSLGDPTTADHLAVLLPGTGSGLHAVDPPLQDVTALHEAAARLAPAEASVATVLDLYAAPLDLGAAADPAPSRLAGTATGAFLTGLPAVPHTTLIGHSYGALTAARTSHAHAVDDLVLLGAPGAGVLHRRDLTGATRVWAAQADDDPITAVADLDEHLQLVPPEWRNGPLGDPLVAHGPDPADPEFGARRLATTATGPGIAPAASRGHLDYLRPGTVTLTNVARVVVGRRPPADGSHPHDMEISCNITQPPEHS